MSLRALRWLLGPKLPVGALHVCRLCGGDFVNPTRWDAEGPDLWRVGLRCGACGHERETIVGPTAAQLFDQALDKGFDRIAETADDLERENMASWVETFSAALRRDLIDAEDF
jgi:hypothetical protein